MKKDLDKNDIIDLGFIYDHSDKDGRTYTAYKNNDIILKEYYNNPNEYALVRQLNNSQQILFDGIIKNKSELLKLMVQLGIIKTFVIDELNS